MALRTGYVQSSMGWMQFSHMLVVFLAQGN